MSKPMVVLGFHMQTYNRYISPRLQRILGNTLIPSLTTFSVWLYGGKECAFIALMRRRVGSQPPQLLIATCYV